MRFDKHTRATAAVTLGVFTLSALASHFLLRLLFSFLMGATETGLEKDIITPGALFLICGLVGLMMAVVSYRPIFGWIKERGFPGLVDAPDPFEGKHIRVGLTVSEAGALWKEVYSQWVPAHHIRDLLKGPVGKKLTLGNQQGERLSIIRAVASEEEGGGDIFVVKFKRDRKVVYNLEMTPGSRGTLETDDERNYATCWYRLNFVGCEGDQTGGWLKFGGETRLMRIAFLEA